MAVTNRKRGGRMPRNCPREASTCSEAAKNPARDARVGLALYVGSLLLFAALGDLLPPGTHRGVVFSEEQQHLATLFGLPCAFVPSAIVLLRTRPALLGLCLAALSTVLASHWSTLDTRVTPAHVVVRFAAGLVVCAAVYRYFAGETGGVDGR
jgi:cytochrome bd-type quinol oxidase subunit 2